MIITRIFHQLYCYFRPKHIKTHAEANKLNLHWQRNVWGDEINTLNCRSIWNDDYMNLYYCDELHGLYGLGYHVFNKQ